MKLNIECVRDILLAIESHPVPMQLSLDDFAKKIPKYNKTEVYYCCVKLYEANYINLEYYQSIGLEPILHYIGDLTFWGHDFLEHIRNDSTWTKAQPILKKIGAFTFDAIKDVTSIIISDLIKQSFT